MKITKCAKISSQEAITMVEQAEEARAAAAATVKTPEAMVVRTDSAVTTGSTTMTVVMRMIQKTRGHPSITITTTIGAEAVAGVAAEVITIITGAGALPRATHLMEAWATRGSSRSTHTAITLKADASLSATWPSRRSGST